MISEGKYPEEIVKTRLIRVTSENLQDIAKDIQMSPTELALMYMNYKQASVQLFIEVKED